jgi:cation diffusion facilitator CzcD-associated flavoprotein CzcO/acetyl esterase/lipase
MSRHLPRPVVRAMTRLVQRSVMRPWIPPGFQRRWHEGVARTLQWQLPEDVTVTPQRLGGVTCERVERAGADRRRAVLYFHGGGYSIGSPLTHRGLTAAISRAARTPVWLPDYRRAPEHPYPGAVEDALAAYRGLLDSGLDPARIAIAGESAGASLAMATVQRLREGGDPLPAGLVLLCGLFDLTRSGSTMETNRRRDAGLHGGWAIASSEGYRGDMDPRHPELSAIEGDLAGLPPIYMQCGTDDILLSDSDRLAERARAAGVSVDYRRYPEMWHGFQLAAGHLREADEAIEEIGVAVRRFWGHQPSAPDGSNGAGRSRTPTVAIVGAGFGGLGLGITLKRAGIDSFTILEKGDRIGGVWRDNTYPGATCDVPSHLYSFSFEPNPDWSRRYSPQPEILDYLEHCVEKYGLGGHLRFRTEVAGAEFDPDAGRWRIETTSGEQIEADILVSSCGQLSRPAVPRIEALDRFEGPIFHSSRWDHGVELSGKRVAVIGTGSSTIQIVPTIADRVGHLDVYQRSAPYVVPKKDRPYRAWEKRLFRMLPGTRQLHRFFQWLFFEVFIAAFNRFKAIGRIGLRMFQGQLDEQVSDPELKQAVTPDSVLGCKRVLISSDWYPTLTRPDVELVTHAVRELTPTGVVAEDGTEREADVIILSTGFAANDFLAPMEIRGLNGVELNEAWRGGAEAYLGISVAGFPNLFIMYGPNTNLGSGSIIFQLESQMNYILDAVRTLQRTGAGYVSVRPEVQEEFSREVQERLKDSVWMTGCNNWYVNEEGRNVNNWPGFTLEYRRRTRRLNLADYEVGNGTGSGEAQLSTRAE